MIKGFLPLSFIDWRGRLSSVLFVGGCNFRCPFCHNSELVLGWERLPDLPLTSLLSYLKQQKRWVESVVVTGGEPTIHKGALDLLRVLKREGFSIKLDTNGSSPQFLRTAIEEGLVQYVAMDVKGPLRDYERYCGTEVRTERIEESISILEQRKVGFEFRMTIVPFLHKEKDIYEVAAFLKDKGPLILQNFRPKNTLDPRFEQIEPFSQPKFDEISRRIETIYRGGSLDETLEPPPP